MEIQNQPQQQLPQGTTSFLRTCFNGMNTLSGVGILSVPFALSQGGWLSLVILFLVAITCWYTGLLLKRCMEIDPSIQTYPDIGQRAFGAIGRALVSITMYLELYLVIVDFLILEGDNLSKLFPHMYWKFRGLNIHSKHVFILLTSVVIWPTTLLMDLGAMANVSVGGILASLILVACVLWTGAFNGVGFHEGNLIWSWEGLPKTASLFTFCYCGHAVFPTFYNSMRDKTQFPKVLTVCFVATTITYGTMAVGGYLMYGEQLLSQITLNLPTAQIIAKIAIYTTLINPITKYGIYITPIATAIQLHFGLNIYLGILVRTAILISTVVVALTFPFFGDVMSFIGAFLSVSVSILMPCIFYLKINTAAREWGFELVWIITILICGCCVGIVGTYTSVKDIISQL